MANDLSVPAIADGQADGQWQTSNDADAVIADALSDIYGGGTGIDFTSGDVTLSATQYRSAMIFKPSEALAANRTLILPGVRRPLWFHNPDATYSVTLKSTDGEEPEDADTFIVGPGQIFLGYTDGNSPGLFGSVLQVTDEGETVAESYDFGTPYYDGQPTASEVVARVPIARDITIPADFDGSVGFTLAANPTAQFDIDVKDDGSSIGTISISTGGVYTFTTDGNTAKSVAAGSLLTFVAPASPDATVDGFQVVIAAMEA